MTEHKTAEAVQAASAALAGAVAPQLIGPEALLWVLAAMGMCSLADVMAPAVPSRYRLAVRYLASVAVTLSASYVVAAVVAHEVPGWRDELWAVRICAALCAGLLLHPVVAMAPKLLGDLWGLVIDGLRAWLVNKVGGGK
jgi:hypothetical protein